MNIIKLLTAPTRFLYLGSWRLALYLLSIIAVSTWLLLQINSNLIRYLLSLNLQAENLTRWSVAAVPFLLALLTLPLAVTVSCLPIREAVGNERISLRRLFEHTVPTYLRCARAMYFAFKPILILGIPAWAMILLYFFFMPRLESAQTYQLYLAGCVLVCLAVLGKIAPLIMAPFITAISIAHPFHVFQAARHVMEGRIRYFLLLTLLHGCAFYAVFLYRSQLSVSYGQLGIYIILLIITWHLFVSYGALALQGVREFDVRVRAASGGPAAQGPIGPQVIRAWVNE
ncbi:MAG: hypothetical protein DCC75_08045 [Proteobacteria bacterium]|nr:MAG: hypothetical protein DCC75_08045 [Pseudomonadota bacterium]